MKKLIAIKNWNVASIAAMVLLTSFGWAQGQENTKFPYTIQQELGASEFATDDQITISAVHGDRPHMEVGGTYLVEGYYTLASEDKADLSLFCTTRGPSGVTPILATQHTNIVKGSGYFRLWEKLSDDGWLHVTFYVNGHSHGGVYFGERGMENTLLRKKGWSDFDPAKTSASMENGTNSDANRALMEYLGNPVPPPADMDTRYSKENLAKAFTAMSDKAGWTITKLAVDDSEFPFLVYGLIGGRHTLEVAQFDAAGGYPYGGSVRGGTDNSTHFAVNMIPQNQFPNGSAQICHRRMIVRLEMLADRAQQAE